MEEREKLKKVFAASINLFTNAYRRVSKVFVVESYEKAIVDTACARKCRGIEVVWELQTAMGRQHYWKAH